MLTMLKNNNGARPIRRVAATGLCAALVLVLVAGVAHEAFAVRLTMKRVIFEGTKRNEVLTIINNTADEQTYRLGFKTMKMTEENGLDTLEEGQTDPALKTADSMVRFAPRRISIPPGGSQQVRLMLNKPKDLPDGEYRSHFWIRPEADAVKFDPKPVDPNASGPSVQIKMLAGVTLPVFVRTGTLTATANITDLKAERKGDRLVVSMVLHREGNRSLYGDFDFVCKANGKVLHQVRGIAVYTEVSKRTIRIPVPVPAEGFGCSSMDLTYKADQADPLFKGGVMATASVAIP